MCTTAGAKSFAMLHWDYSQEMLRKFSIGKFSPVPVHSSVTDGVSTSLVASIYDVGSSSFFGVKTVVFDKSVGRKDALDIFEVMGGLRSTQ
jgi:hypothetical protein